MAKKAIIKSIVLFLSLPFFVVSLISEYFNLWNIKQDIEKCHRIVTEYKGIKIPTYFWESLVVAEDRRNALHKGIDPIAMIRAIKIKIQKNEHQGASTIEQQFVRVVSKRYEKRLSRKIREQLLALAVSRRFSKKEIAVAYLCIAYYGSGKVGIKGVHKISGTQIEKVSFDISVSIISRLKYPEPIEQTAKWKKKHYSRNIFIKERLENGLYKM